MRPVHQTSDAFQQVAVDPSVHFGQRHSGQRSDVLYYSFD